MVASKKREALLPFGHINAQGEQINILFTIFIREREFVFFTLPALITLTF